ncbi:iron hydrogenase small subunit [Wolinella succinogenes]|uniref:iron hydrogenase small subunit n=1 Tax=Wolinella succinogenes TaxID=844 RepID=UPI002FCAEA46
MAQYQYIEKSTGQIFSRRDFLKVAGVSVTAIAVSGYVITDVIKKRKSYIAMRQQGLYKDDKRLQKVNMTGSHQNNACFQAYKDLKTSPMGETAEKLLHTKTYVNRRNLELEGVRHA